MLPHVVMNAFDKLQTTYLPPLIFIDTGYFPESTYRMVKALEGLGFELKVYSPPMSTAMQEALYGNPSQFRGEEFELFKQRVKHEPLNRAFSELDINLWLRAIRYYQTDERAQASLLEKINGLYRLHPILDWSRQDVEDYIAKNKLLYRGILGYE